MPLVEFRRKAARLLQLSEAGLLHKARNPVARDPAVTRNYRKDLIARIDALIRPRNPEFADRLVHRVTVRMSVDHVHELQLGGPDIAANLRMLDRTTNETIGARQIRPQLAPLPDGTPVRIEVTDIAELGRRVAEAVNAEGRSAYAELAERFSVPIAELRGAVRNHDSLQERDRHCENCAPQIRKSGER